MRSEELGSRPQDIPPTLTLFQASTQLSPGRCDGRCAGWISGGAGEACLQSIPQHWLDVCPTDFLVPEIPR